MKVLVTGASGFLGARLVAALLSAGHSVRAMVRRSMPDRHGNGAPLEYVQADLLSGTSLHSACTGVDAVVHLAMSLTGPGERMLATAVTGTTRLLAALDERTRHVVLVSSLSVVDWSKVGATLDDEGPVLADADAVELGAYALAKVRQENAARRICAEKNLGLVVVRPAMVWGPDHSGLDAVGPAFGPFQCVVAARRSLRLSYFDNCVSALLLTLDPRAVGRTMNIEDGHDVDAATFAACLAPHRCALHLPLGLLGALRIVGRPFSNAARANLRVPGLLVPARALARFHPARVAPGAIRDVLGWTPPISFEAALQRLPGTSTTLHSTAARTEAKE